MKHIRYKRNFISAFLVFFIAGISCKKSQIATFDFPVASVYFHTSWAGTTWPYWDSAVIRLGYSDNDSVFRLALQLFGKTENTDRPYNLSFLNTSTAKEGTDYTWSGKQAIPANQYSDTVVFDFKNLHLDTAAPAKYVYLQILPNNNFDTVMKDAYAFGDSITNPYSYKISVDYRAPKPYFWDNNISYLGTYSQKKIKLLIQQENMNINYVIDSLRPAWSYNATDIRQFATDFQTYLNAQAAAGNVISDEDGSPMKMGPSLAE